MKRTTLILAVLCAGCSSASSQTADATAPGYTARERQLIELCNEIAIEREILVAKYNALLSVYRPEDKQEPLTAKRCS
jgi:hypothetical protein